MHACVLCMQRRISLHRLGKCRNSTVFDAHVGAPDAALGININATSVSDLPESGAAGKVYFLTADAGGFAAGTLVEWKNGAWVEYEGVVEA